LRANRRTILAFAIIAGLTIPGYASAYWTARGRGTGTVQTGTLDLTGPRPVVRKIGRDVSIAWTQSQLTGRRLGDHQEGAYRVLRNDVQGLRQEMRPGCLDVVTGDEDILRCIEHDVPNGYWEYRILPVLGGWSGKVGPPGSISIDAGAMTIAEPADGAVINDQRPVIEGTALRGSSVAVVLSSPHQPIPPLRIAATLSDTTWIARLPQRLPQGKYAIRVQQIDASGNILWSRSHRFGIDISAPTTIDNAALINEGWKRTDQTISVRASDRGGSGVRETFYTTDGSIPTARSSHGSSATVGEGVHTIRYFSLDNAGNAETVKTSAVQIRVDRTAPWAVDLAPLPSRVHAGQVLKAAGEDAMSGIARAVFEFCADTSCTSWTPIGKSTGRLDLSLRWTRQPADGTYLVRVRVFDAAGNSTASDAQMVRVDNGPVVA
jgi:hypothetical protein